MRRLRILVHRMRSVFRRGRQEEELAREIELHVEQLVKELIADGMTEKAARLEARRQFGPIAAAKEECRDMRRVNLMDDVLRDLVYACRLFRKSPVFTLAAIISLALGIGANTAIFRLFDAVRLRSLPVERPAELVSVRVAGQGPAGNFRGRNGEITNAIWEEFQRRQRTFAGALAYGDTPFNLAPSGEVRNVEGLWVSGSFFPVLGVRPQIGRLFTPSDDQRGCGWPGVVISHSFWQREFGGDPGVVSRTLPIEGQTVPILGVTPPEFFGVEVGRRFDVAMPICSAAAADLNNRSFWFLSIIARLKPGASEAAARAELAALSPAVFASTMPRVRPREQALYAKLRLQPEPAASGRSSFRETFQQPLTFLLCMVVFVLLLACANLANMMLARATAREHEFAVRASLGASRTRLIRQVLMESLLLALAGAGAGAAAAPSLCRMLVRMLSTTRDPIFLSVDGNWRVLAFTVAAGLAATVLFGLAPALRAGRAEARGASASREKFRFRQVLLVLQVSLCMLLLTAALLFSRSFRNLLTVDTGFQAHGILVANTFFNTQQYPPDRRLAAYEALQERLAAIPGVSGVARSFVVPISGSGWDRGARVSPSEPGRAVNLTSISEGFFRVMNTPLLAGRDFNSEDRPGTQPVAIVNQAFAKLFFGSVSPVGRTFQLDGPEPPFEIVGLAGNAKYRTLQEVFGPIVYLAAGQERAPRSTARYLIRAGGSPERLIKPVTRVLAAMDPQLSVRFVALESQLQESVLRERMMATLTTAFGVLAAMLALTGVFGVTAYMVARRYREFGVRIALGASRGGIVRMVLGELAKLMACGVILGGSLAILAGRAASTLLYGVKPQDASTITMVIALLAGGGLLAGILPALRASRVPPAVALRIE